MFDLVYQIDAVSKLDESSGAAIGPIPAASIDLVQPKYLFSMNGLSLRRNAAVLELSILRRGRMPQNGGDLRFACQLRRLADRSCH